MDVASYFYGEAASLEAAQLLADRAAEVAVRKFRFKPARTSDGRNVEYPIVWTMTFQLDR